MKLPGVISLRKDLPIWPMPNGQLLARGALDVGEVDEDALRGLGAQIDLVSSQSSVTPWKVLNIRLNWRMPVKSCLPQYRAGDVVLRDVVLHLLR